MTHDFSRAPLPPFVGQHVAAAAAAARPSTGTVVMQKRPGERSFGMTLEQQRTVSPADFPRVSFVFPELAASRAGLKSGCVIEAVDHRSVQGCSVKAVAELFRERAHVTLQVRWTLAPTPNVAAIEQQKKTLSIALQSILSAQAANPTTQVTTISQAAVASAQPSPQISPPLPAPPVQVPSVVTIAAGQTKAASAASPDPVVATVLAAQQRGSASEGQQLHVPKAEPTSGIAPTVSAAAQEQAEPEPSPEVAPRERATSELQATATTALQLAEEAPAAVPVEQAVEQAVEQQANVSSKPEEALPTVNMISDSTPAPAPPSFAPPSQPTEPTYVSSRETSAPAASPQGPQTPRGSGKKRARPSPSPSSKTTSPTVSRPQAPIPDVPSARSHNGHATSSDQEPPTGSSAKKARGGRAGRRRESLTPPDSDDAICLLGRGRKRRYSTRQSESGGRVRRSLTVDRLVTMGFKREDAESSVGACGHDVEKCMVWIVSHLEEKQFLNDLNQASIESELSKRAEESQQKKQESETLKQATAFTSLFPTSYVLSSESEAPRLKALLSSTIGSISAETLMRATLTRLLKLEAQAIRWYKEASRCYLLQLASRLEAAMASHDVMSCCARWMASDAASRSSSCTFVQTLYSEEQALTTALFHMPENHGGVPLEFLRADESMQFSLEDDGFEVLDEAPVVTDVE
ncbi:hypothetical protein P43SY_006381 [Pythium insidiosum]|uniref:UBA domain-containing protein n=1 Tax=Pythium insidiosum TaxID=114742 RepID=A0AAD5LKM0_PYTIN|nr:hypothetical protein P43SY_006381 [Pythium insidiosum]